MVWAGSLKTLLDAVLSITAMLNSGNGKLALLFLGYLLADLAAVWLLL